MDTNGLIMEFHDNYEIGDDLPEDILNTLQYVKRRVNAVLWRNHGLEERDITVHIYSDRVEVVFLPPWQEHSFTSRN